ncbi:MAG: asparagine synthase C-terminal domain-containing protein [Gammaproteobacteria bacterium]|nr:asparagine synthase C-terminal domain-containing protein [Gammaproteobacteria bacterium]
MPSDQCYMSYISILSPEIRGSFFTNREKFSQYYDQNAELIYSYFNSKNVEGDKDSLDRALYCDIKTYLPEDILALTDRISMQHSLEVRVPFIDHKVMEFCATIPPELRMKGFKKKYLLKKSMSNILPEEVINHRKQGFVGPTSNWIKNDLREYILNTLSENNIKKHGYINVKTVNKLLDEHFSGKQIHDKLIWAMVVFQKWYELNIEQHNSVNS